MSDADNKDSQSRFADSLIFVRLCVLLSFAYLTSWMETSSESGVIVAGTTPLGLAVQAVPGAKVFLDVQGVVREVGRGVVPGPALGAAAVCVRARLAAFLSPLQLDIFIAAFQLH